MVFINGYCFSLSVVVLDIFLFLFLKGHHLGFKKTFFRQLSPNYWKCERELVKRCKLFGKYCTLFSAKGIVTRECAAHHDMALEPLSAN